MAACIRAAAPAILAANADDVAEAKSRGQAGSFLDRLTFDDSRVEAIAAAVESIADLPDPVGRALATFERPNGLVIERVATPLGVVGMIFESRPNVTADAGALASKPATPLSCAPDRTASGPRLFSPTPCGTASRGGLARGRHPAGADPRPGGRRRHADRARRRPRRDRAARRQEPRRAGAGGGAGAGLRPSRGHLPRLRACRRRSRDGHAHRAQRQDAPHRRLRSRRDAARRPRLHADPSAAAGSDPARRRLRRPRRRRHAGGRPARHARFGR